mmetsp:Transcript_2038/g.2353  ORF Transcript_2038/g.2353 Transcript_2038/m.2353 type:complete len:89 (+) Transcript_2038:826-1092(+)
MTKLGLSWTRKPLKGNQVSTLLIRKALNLDFRENFFRKGSCELRRNDDKRVYYIQVYRRLYRPRNQLCLDASKLSRMSLGLVNCRNGI